MARPQTKTENGDVQEEVDVEGVTFCHGLSQHGVPSPSLAPSRSPQMGNAFPIWITPGLSLRAVLKREPVRIPAVLGG